MVKLNMKRVIKIYKGFKKAKGWDIERRIKIIPLKFNLFDKITV
jgi:hypothetical protein